MSKTERCNVCGRRVNPGEGFGFVKVTDVLGYGSKHDMELLNMNICYSCIDYLVNHCKINPFDSGVDQNG